MNDAPPRLVYFARGLDGFYLPDNAGWELFALVRADTPEAAWAETFLPPGSCLKYSFAPDDPYPATEEILRGSDIARILRQNELRNLLLSSTLTPVVHDWGQRHAVRLIASDFEQQARLEDKLWFDRFLRRHAIPRPASAVVTVRRPLPAGLAGRVVVQRAHSLGGEGTFFLPSLADFPALAAAQHLPAGERCLARQYVAGLPYGVTVFVAPGLVALSAIRLQCYYPAAADETARVWAGVQWVPGQQLSASLRSRIEAVFLRLGEQLYRRRFFGFANCDFVVDDAEAVWVIECNPRMSAATPQLLGNPALGGGLPLGELFLAGFLRPRRYPRRWVAHGLPAAGFAGATLEIVGGVRSEEAGDRQSLPAILGTATGDCKSRLRLRPRQPPAGQVSRPAPTVRPADAGRLCEGSRDFESPDAARIRRTFPSGLYALAGADVRYLGPDVRGMTGPDHFCLFSFAAVGQTCDAETTLASILANFRLYDDAGQMNDAARRLVAHFRYT